MAQRTEVHLSDPDEVTPEALQDIATKDGAHLKSLTINLEYDEGVKTDVGHALSSLSFPALETLSITSCMAGVLTLREEAYPALKSLELSNIYEAMDLNLYLPKLEDFSAEFCSVDDGTLVAKSLSRCISLKSVRTYKLWGLSHGFSLVSLPNCTSLSLYRSDDLDKLFLYAPKLTQLSVRACYDLNSFKLIDSQVTSEQVDEYYEMINTSTPKEERMYAFMEFMSKASRKATRIAREKEWIEPHEKWDPENDYRQQEWLEHMMHENERECNEQSVFKALKRIVPPLTTTRPSTPKILVYHENTNLSRDVVREMVNHPRIGKENLAQSDEARQDMMSWGGIDLFGRYPDLMMGDVAQNDKDEDDDEDEDDDDDDDDGEYDIGSDEEEGESDEENRDDLDEN